MTRAGAGADFPELLPFVFMMKGVYIEPKETR